MLRSTSVVITTTGASPLIDVVAGEQPDAGRAVQRARSRRTSGSTAPSAASCRRSCRRCRAPRRSRTRRRASCPTRSAPRRAPTGRRRARRAALIWNGVERERTLRRRTRARSAVGGHGLPVVGGAWSRRSSVVGAPSRSVAPAPWTPDVVSELVVGVWSSGSAGAAASGGCSPPGQTMPRRRSRHEHDDERDREQRPCARDRARRLPRRTHQVASAASADARSPTSQLARGLAGQQAAGAAARRPGRRPHQPDEQRGADHDRGRRPPTRLRRSRGAAGRLCDRLARARAASLGSSLHHPPDQDRRPRRRCTWERP